MEGLETVSYTGGEVSDGWTDGPGDLRYTPPRSLRLEPLFVTFETRNLTVPDVSPELRTVTQVASRF